MPNAKKRQRSAHSLGVESRKRSGERVDGRDDMAGQDAAHGSADFILDDSGIILAIEAIGEYRSGPRAAKPSALP